jgi:hypothetical protein
MRRKVKTDLSFENASQSQSAKIPRCKNTTLQKYHVAKIPRCRNVTLQKCHVAKIPRCKNTTLQKYHVAEIPRCKNVTARIAKPNNPPEFKQPAGVQTTRRSSNNPPEFRDRNNPPEFRDRNNPPECHQPAGVPSKPTAPDLPPFSARCFAPSWCRLQSV